MDAIQDSLSQMMQSFHKRLDSIEGQLPNASPETSEGLAAEFAAFKTFVIATFRALQNQIGILALQIDQGEMRARRKILLLHGLPEEQKEDTPLKVVEVVREKLKLSGISISDISRCHRMGRLAPDRPRPILFKLRDVANREKIWSSKTSLKGSGITLSEFLTKTRHDVFQEARQRFGITKCWTREGSIFVLGPDGARHRVSSLDDLSTVQAKMAPADTKPQASGSQEQPPRKKRERPVRK